MLIISDGGSKFVNPSNFEKSRLSEQKEWLLTDTSVRYGDIFKCV